MSEKFIKIAKAILLILLGGICYVGIEIAFRGYSHWTMFLLGGICFFAIGSINECFPWEMPLVDQMLLSMLLVTVLEFVFGVVLNIWCGLGIWDYSNLPYNLFGQICLLFSVAWFFLSAVAIVLDDILRYLLFREEFPRYQIFYKINKK